MTVFRDCFEFDPFEKKYLCLMCNRIVSTPNGMATHLGSKHKLIGQIIKDEEYTGNYFMNEEIYPNWRLVCDASDNNNKGRHQKLFNCVILSALIQSSPMYKRHPGPLFFPTRLKILILAPDPLNQGKITLSAFAYNF